MTLTIDHLRMNRTIMEILRKFPAIQNKPQYEYHTRGKGFYYGLKSSDFNKFDFNNGDRIFNYWRDKLVEVRFLIKIQPFKKKGSPYAVTPLGIAYILQNLEVSKPFVLDTDFFDEVSNCLDVMLHFYKGDSFGLNYENNLFHFWKACKMIEFGNFSNNLRTLVGDDLEFDMSLDLSVQDRVKTNNPDKEKQVFQDVANHIIGSMCWLQLHNRKMQISGKKWAESVGNNYFEMQYVSDETIKLGKTFGDNVVLKTLAEESQRVVEVLELNSYDSNIVT